MRTTRDVLPRRRRRLPPAFVTAALAALALGCGDSTGPGSSAFSATVTGATNRSYAGEALAIADAIGFALLLESSANEGPDQLEIFLVRELSSLPTVRSYAIGSPADPALAAEDFSAAIKLSFGEPDERDCTSEEGTITFTSASAELFVGEFEFTMSCTLTDDPESPVQEASVEGTFQAVAAIPL